jgi:plastocyanin
MRFPIGLTALLAIVACGSDSPTSTGTNTNATYDVYTIGDTFSPALGLPIAPNDTILWHFSGGSDGNGHNVRFFPLTAGSPADITVQKTGTLRRVFSTKGDFNYVCDVHPGMNGEIIVQ